MGSRLRTNVKHLFECFCEVAGPQGKDPAWVIQKYPESYKDESVMKNVPKFAYPCKIENTCIEHYSFVFTDLDSKWTFGYCRHDPKCQTALVILSYLPWHESFYKLLNCIAEIMYSNKAELLWKFLEEIIQSKIPEYGATIHVTSRHTTYTCQAPSQFQLPSIPENRNLTEYYNAIEPMNMLQIFASMLYERRIIITSKRLSRLSACIQAANAVIYPMYWQHIFIPVLPDQLIEYLNAPMPYLIGLPESLVEKLNSVEPGDIVLLNADTNVLTTPYKDLESLPGDVVNNLRRQLRNKPTVLGDGVSRAFLRALVQLIGGYRDALKFHQGEKITFNKDAFVESRPAPIQPFLKKMLELQIFQQFIEERLDMLNSGMGFSDEFELEACNYMDKSSNKLKIQYKEWKHTFKKEGSAFFKTMKSRVQKDVKKIAYEGLRSRKKDQPKTSREEKSNSAPSSPIQQRKNDLILPPLQSNKYSALDLASSPDLSPLEMNMDLMSDLQHVIFKGCSPTAVRKTLLGEMNIQPPPKKEQMSETDLIHLDSTPSEDESKSITSPGGISPSSTQLFAGVENPLYPYFIPKSLKENNQEEASTSSNDFKQNISFFNSLSSTSAPSTSLRSTPAPPTSLRGGCSTPTKTYNQMNLTSFTTVPPPSSKAQNTKPNAIQNSHNSNFDFLNLKSTSNLYSKVNNNSITENNNQILHNQTKMHIAQLFNNNNQNITSSNLYNSSQIKLPLNQNISTRLNQGVPLTNGSTLHNNIGNGLNHGSPYNNSNTSSFSNKLITSNISSLHKKQVPLYGTNNKVKSSSSGVLPPPSTLSSSTFITNERTAFLKDQLGPSPTKKTVDEWTTFDS